MADRFSLRSHRIGVEWNRLRDDVFVSQQRFLPGTRVEMLQAEYVSRSEAKRLLANIE